MKLMYSRVQQENIIVTNIYLDIETIPSQDPAVRAEIEKSISPPGNYSKPETIAKWEQEQKPALVDEAMLRTGLDGAYGHVLVIGYAIDDKETDCVIHENEKALITDFYRYLSEHFDPSRDMRPTFIGHNILNFDLRFLYQRSIINGIKPPHFIPFHAKPWDDRIFDTMTKWAGDRGSVSLDKLCKVFGLPPKGSEIGEEMDGSKVYELFKANRLDDIAKYCRGDVERVRQLYRRMTFQVAA